MNVKGLPYSPDDLVTRSLCKSHNEALSSIDVAAIDLNNALRRFEELREARSKLFAKPVRTVAFRVQGCMLEKWALKTIMNFAVLRGRKDGPWAQPSWLPDVIFGKRTLPDGCGLALCVKVGDQILPSDEITFCFGGTSKEHPQAAVITLRGGTVKFLLTWDFPLNRMAMDIDGETYNGGAEAMFHPVEMRDRGLKLAVRFDWEVTAKRHPSVVSLAARYRSPPRR